MSDTKKDPEAETPPTEDAASAPTCLNCPYWSEIEGRDGYGECRRRAPREIAIAGEVGPDWTVMPEFGWCGDHPGRDLSLNHSHVAATSLQVVAAFFAAQLQASEKPKGPKIAVPNPGYPGTLR